MMKKGRRAVPLGPESFGEPRHYKKERGEAYTGGSAKIDQLNSKKRVRGLPPRRGGEILSKSVGGPVTGRSKRCCNGNVKSTSRGGLVNLNTGRVKVVKEPIRKVTQTPDAQSRR